MHHPVYSVVEISLAMGYTEIKIATYITSVKNVRSYIYNSKTWGYLWVTILECLHYFMQAMADETMY